MRRYFNYPIGPWNREPSTSILGTTVSIIILFFHALARR